MQRGGMVPDLLARKPMVTIHSIMPESLSEMVARIGDQDFFLQQSLKKSCCIGLMKASIHIQTSNETQQCDCKKNHLIRAFGVETDDRPIYWWQASRSRS
ncbi:hypothetical protein L1987_65960 [Smallanthus sonchifolius]|uniref:Uncharacterized protein n=1 Tax=Smallanthus sonchifolius TaxID=185202 RepID=A0ACB9BVW3_9ASTR|nr:hypothetical protein L1987_65960 [Smallanthus sonchifolius]